MGITAFETKAWLWNGQDRIPGILKLQKNRVKFQFTNFPQSNLSLEIELKDITKVDTILIFGISKLGISIQSSADREDQFVLANPTAFLEALNLLSKK